MFLQYTKYRDIDAVTWHDACHVTKSPGSPSAFLWGGSKVIHGIIARKEGEPGNEARCNHQSITTHLSAVGECVIYSSSTSHERGCEEALIVAGALSSGSPSRH